MVENRATAGDRELASERKETSSMIHQLKLASERRGRDFASQLDSVKVTGRSESNSSDVQLEVRLGRYRDCDYDLSVTVAKNKARVRVPPAVEWDTATVAESRFRMGPGPAAAQLRTLAGRYRAGPST